MSQDVEETTKDEEADLEEERSPAWKKAVVSTEQPVIKSVLTSMRTTIESRKRGVS